MIVVLIFLVIFLLLNLYNIIVLVSKNKRLAADNDLKDLHISELRREIDTLQQKNRKAMALIHRVAERLKKDGLTTTTDS